MSESFTCASCGRVVPLSYEEQRSYRERKKPFPRYCKECWSRIKYERDSGNKGMSGAPTDLTFTEPDETAARTRPDWPSPRQAAQPPRPSSYWPISAGPAGPVQADFDRIALLPEAAWSHNAHYHHYLLSHVPPHCNEALEIGCGTGAFSRLLAQRSEHVTAIDFSPYMLRAARERSVEYPNIDYYLEEAQKHRFTAGQLDCIVSIATLHHLPFEKMLFKFKTALKPKGVLLILDLYQQKELADWLISAAALPVDVVMKLVRLGRLRDSQEARAAWDMHGQHDSYMTLAQIRKVCAAVLPGAKVRRHLLWRYSIIWEKIGPAGETGAG